jgi:hypothetical protein
MYHMLQHLEILLFNEHFIYVFSKSYFYPSSSRQIAVKPKDK